MFYNMYTCVRNEDWPMGTLKVGIREFREKLATYLLETDQAVAITRHGDTVGYYIPARRKRTEAERTALEEAALHLQQAMAAAGVSEDEIIRDFKRWRRGDRK
jgi:PHD/YefM family antitoxin component YafN of YafNO toxin-antitoxin module